MKKGITVSILVITVILMFIIVTMATVIGTRAIQTASYEEFTSKIVRVADDVNQYIIANKTLPTTSEIIAKEGLADTLVAEINKNNDATNNLFVVDMTKLRTESVNIGTGSVEDMDVFVVAENTNNVYYLKGIEYRGITYHGIYNESYINENGVPIKWQQNVVSIVDGVPIPKGFVASQAEGENTKNGGLVIYEGTEVVTNTNVEDARRNRNQYVWVPVEDFRNFTRQKFAQEGGLSNTLGDEYWEIVLGTNNMPLLTQSTSYITSTTLAEVQAMYASVKEYKGFYIARYEAGLTVGNHKIEDDGEIIKSVHSKMNKAPYNYVRWTYNNSMDEDTDGAVEIARSIYPETNANYGVVSTLTYGVQWDRTLMWWVETKAKNGTSEVTITSIEDLEYDTCMYYGVYDSNEIPNEVINEGASYSDDYGESFTPVTSSYSKTSHDAHLLTTGASEETRVNNIYDMAGNVEELTMEGYTSHYRVARGGHYNGDGFPANNRDYISLDTAWDGCGFRTSLYIKK